MTKRSLRVDQVEDTPISKAREKSRCAWRDCHRPIPEDAPPLCAAHLQIAHDLYLKANQSEPATFRVSVAAQEDPDPAPQEAATGVVYYLRSGAYIKIGWTSNLASRMKAYPPDTLLLATEDGTRKDEARRHRQFAAHRTHGREWYAMSADIVRHIDRIKATNGAPDEVHFAARPVQIPTPRTKSYVGGNYRGNGIIGNPRN